MDLAKFLYPRSSYHGQFKPQNLVFNSNLQEFTTRVNYIAGLETNGKISPAIAYEKIPPVNFPLMGLSYLTQYDCSTLICDRSLVKRSQIIMA